MVPFAGSILPLAASCAAIPGAAVATILCRRGGKRSEYPDSPGNLRHLDSLESLDVLESLAQLQHLSSDTIMYVLCSVLKIFRVGTTDFVFVSWIDADCDADCNDV